MGCHFCVYTSFAPGKSSNIFLLKRGMKIMENRFIFFGLFNSFTLKKSFFSCQTWLRPFNLFRILENYFVMSASRSERQDPPDKPGQKSSWEVNMLFGRSLNVDKNWQFEIFPNSKYSMGDSVRLLSRLAQI